MAQSRGPNGHFRLYMFFKEEIEANENLLDSLW
jgi:hypothetical protein